MKDGPAEMQRQLIPAEQGNQNEDELARIHVAEQTQRQRDRLGEERDALENEVERDDDRRADYGDALRRRRDRVHRELFREADHPFDLDRVVDRQQEDV